MGWSPPLGATQVSVTRAADTVPLKFDGTPGVVSEADALALSRVPPAAGQSAACHATDAAKQCHAMVIGALEPFDGIGANANDRVESVDGRAGDRESQPTAHTAAASITATNPPRKKFFTDISNGRS